MSCEVPCGGRVIDLEGGDELMVSMTCGAEVVVFSAIADRGTRAARELVRTTLINMYS